MACKYYVIVLLGLLISSCAQVGVISGGDVDTFAPKPIADEIVPPIETTNFQGNKIEIPFDEFFRLVNPVENIRMVPPHATIVAEVKNKTLILSWNDTLESNTTYAIYLNSAVKDLTEGNDSIMQYVFSTGSFLDTLSYTIPILDAWSGKPEDDCIVALYEPGSDKLVSLAQPSDGIAKLSYLPSGEYTLVAFKDENNDLKFQEYERVGFPEGGTVRVSSNTLDSIPLRMYKPKSAPKVTSLKFIPPCSFTLASNVNLSLSGIGDQVPPTRITVDGVPLHPFAIDWLSDDSLKFQVSDLTAPSVEVIVQTEFFTDTLSYRYKPKERDAKITIKSLNKSIVLPSKMPRFSVNAFITGYDSTLIHITNTADSSEITAFTVVKRGSEFEILLDKTNLTSIKIAFDQGAIHSSCGNSEELESVQTIQTEDDYGALNVDVSGYSGAIIVDLLQRNQVISSNAMNDTESPLVLTELTPGEYSFRVIRDANGNGKWDVGEYSTLTQPEAVDTYSKKTKIRANWTIDVTLTPTN